MTAEIESMENPAYDADHAMREAAEGEGPEKSDELDDDKIDVRITDNDLRAHGYTEGGRRKTFKAHNAECCFKINIE